MGQKPADGGLSKQIKTFQTHCIQTKRKKTKPAKMTGFVSNLSPAFGRGFCLFKTVPPPFREYGDQDVRISIFEAVPILIRSSRPASARLRQGQSR